MEIVHFRNGSGVDMVFKRLQRITGFGCDSVYIESILITLAAKRTLSFDFCVIFFSGDKYLKATKYISFQLQIQSPKIIRAQSTQQHQNVMNNPHNKEFTSFSEEFYGTNDLANQLYIYPRVIW